MKYGLIAERVGHSFSAEIHSKLFGYSYELKAIAKDELADFLKNREFEAINVTIPYKEAVIPYLDFVDETALAIGAVNTIVNKNGKLYGYNTDLPGLCALIKRVGLDLKDKKVLVLGSGGTSKTAFYAAKQLGCSNVFRVSRSGRDSCITYEAAVSEHSDAEIIINTTPSGMFPNIGASAVDINCFPKLSGVIDAVYNPLRPKLVCDALSKGIKSSGGLYMLVAQAAFAAEKFVGKTVAPERIDEIYNEIYSSKQSIVLVGMPGCGKSTVGKILSEKLGLEFIDTDELITQKTGKTPSEIISERGESEFRDIESEVIREVAVLQSKVISTGGGAVLRKVNVELLKENGRVYFIDRPLEELVPTSNRPLSADRQALEKRFKERYHIYCSCCDYRVETVGTAEKYAGIVLKELGL